MFAVLDTPTVRNATLLGARILLTLIFLMSGADKIVHYADTQGYMAEAGVPGSLLPLAILTELGGGLLVLTGWQTRLAACALSGFTLVSALLFHLGADQQIHLMKNISMAGGFLALAVSGAGAWSLDRSKA